MSYIFTKKRASLIKALILYALNEMTAMDDWEMREMFGYSSSEIFKITDEFLKFLETKSNKPTLKG